MLAALSACGSAPAVHLHSLMPLDVAPPADARGRAGDVAPLFIVLDPVRMPASVDKPQWLVQLPDGSLASLEQERWASPLRDEFQRALLETLIVQFGAVELRHSGDAVSNAAGALRVDVDVRRFESAADREGRIEGSWTITSAAPGSGSDKAALHCEWRLREAAPGSLAALAEAHRRAVARLAVGIGSAMREIRRGEPSKCPQADELR